MFVSKIVLRNQYDAAPCGSAWQGLKIMDIHPFLNPTMTFYLYKNSLA
jgi:hypothetical protein